ncbi:MAG TPA: rod shape-determining protein MreD [Lachnospiraceae bacterium]|nr:rod shape-determining protein MreD [Lachnospiraceae bacterium]
MLRKIIVFFMIIIGYLLQCTFFQNISLGGIVPNILIIITSSFGFMRGKKEGMIIGFLAGLILDIFFGDILGFYSLIYMYIGYLNGFFRRIFYPEDIKLPMILITLSELLYCFLCYIFLFLLRGKLHFGYYFIHVILPEIVYTILATLIVYKTILWVNEWLETKEKRSA